ncbi:BspA type Leucine rich repeat region [anaerobic digester metagenome]
MKKKLVYWCVCWALIFLAVPLSATATELPVGVAYRGHIQDRGDYPLDGSWVDSPDLIGTVGQSKRIEGFEIKLNEDLPMEMSIRYNVHVQNRGWLYDENDPTDWPRDGAYAGTRGESLRIEAVKIVLTDSAGKPVPGYSVQYRGHVQNLGDQPQTADSWLADGAQLGTVGSSLRLEALLVRVVKNNADLTAYNALVAKVDKLNEADFTAPSWTALQMALKEHAVTADRTQAEVDAALAMIQAAYEGLTKKTGPTVYDKAGTYGPASGSQTIDGDVRIAADGVILQNLTITGDMLISEAVGNGTVTLNNVTVDGDTLVRGGGANSIHINGGRYSRIVMEKTASGAVRIVATGVDGLDVIIAEDASGETIILEGAFDSVEINAPNMTVTTQGNTTTIGKMTVGETGGSSTVTVNPGTTVSELVLDGKAAIKGQGNVVKAEVKADGAVFDKKPASYTVAPGVVIPPVFPTPSDGGGGYNPPAPVAVTGVSLNLAAFDLQLDDQASLTATVAPATASNPAVTWSSSDTDVVAVAADGSLTGKAKGIAVITVTTSDGAKTASCTVMVIDKVFAIAGDGTITAYLGTGTVPIIPEMINGITVTAIGSNAFKNKNIYTIDLPMSLTAIAADAFADCSNLDRVSFGNSGTTVADTAFIGCNNLKNLMYCGNAPASFNSTAFPAVNRIEYYQGATGFDGIGIFGSCILAPSPPRFNSNFIAGNADVLSDNVNAINNTVTILIGEAADLSKIIFCYFRTTPGVAVTVNGHPVLVGITELDFSGSPLTFMLTPVTGNGAPVNYVVTVTKNLGGSVTIGGDAVAGQTLTVNTAALQKPNWLTPVYQWQRETATAGSYEPIAGANAATYQTTDADVDKNIRVSLTLPVVGGDAVVSPAVKVKSPFTVDSTNPGVITGYIGSGGMVVIPQQIDGVPITGIGDNAFKGKNNVTSVSIPQTVTSIGDGAFMECFNMTSLTFAGTSQLTAIGDKAFQGCQKLERVSLPASVKTIGASGFMQCFALKDLNLGSVETIGANAFYECTGLVNLTIPNSLTSIGTQAFCYCTGLKTVEFLGGSNLQTLLGASFFQCSSLETVTFAADNRIEDIKYAAFQDCSNLKQVNFSAAMTQFGHNAFSGCPANLVLRFDGNAPSVDSAAIPAGTTIEYWEDKSGFMSGVWPGCSLKLRNISLTQTDVTINTASFSFDAQTGATEVKLQKKAHTDSAWIDATTTEALTSASTTATATGLTPGINYDFRLWVTGGDNAGPSIVVNLTTLVAVENIILNKTTLELSANGSETLTAPVIPSDAANQDINWTSTASAVATVNSNGLVTAVAAGTTTITATAADGGGAYASCTVTVLPYSFTVTDGKVTITKYLGSETTVSIPGTIGGNPVVAIGYQAFKSKANLTEVTIPASVTSIGEGAFHMCQKLTTVHFATDSQLISIDLNGFSECPLTSLTLPSQLHIISNYSFYHNHLSGSLTIPATVTYIGDNAFEGKMEGTTHLSSLETLTIQSTGGVNIRPSAFKFQPLTTINLPAGVSIDGDPSTMGTNGTGFLEAYLAGGAGIYQYDSGSAAWSK